MQYDEQQRLSKDLPLSVIDSSGRQISLLNDNNISSSTTEYPHSSKEPYSPSSSSSSDEVVQPSDKTLAPKTAQSPKPNTRRKYHCAEPGCNKSFTTSGHLARHNRIHTGEKNFPCLFPGCQSRFSRQDNMMQHYRTHMSPKSRRTQRKSGTQNLAEEEPRPRPRLHAHHKIRSDPYQVDPPLTIDQHLSNYHQSLRSPSARKTSSLSQAGSTTPLYKISEKSNDTTTTSSTTAGRFSSTISPPSSSTATPAATVTQQQQVQTPLSPFSNTTFYQHQPLKLHAPAGQAPFPFTLLHPPIVHQRQQRDSEGEHDTSDKNQSTQNLMQLAHVVSTFG